VVAAFTLLFGWLYARPLVEDGWLSGTDLYDYYLPIFLSPITIWSAFELSGMPAFVDSQNAAFYPVNLLFARLLPSWTAYIVSAYVLAASFTYAYVYHHTRSRLAAALAGIAFGMSEALMERVDHIAIVHTMAWLPLAVLAVDRVRDALQNGAGANPPDEHVWHRRLTAARWVAVGAFALGCSLLAGHTQFAIYIFYATGLYAAVGGIVAGVAARYAAAIAALFVAAVLLAAVSALPLWEARPLMVRQTVGFGQFVSHSNTPLQMLSMLFPAIVHEGRDAPTYVGLAVLVFALVGVYGTRRHWIVPFWLVVGTAAMLTGVGDATPLAALLYELPLNDSFRVVARHMFLGAFALAVIGGVGISLVLERRVSWRGVGGAAAFLIAVLAAGAAAIARQPQLFEIERGAWPALFEGLGVPPPVAAQLVIAAAAAAICTSLALVRTRRAAAAVVLVLLVGDLGHALPYRLRWYGVEAPVEPRQAVEPSVHARTLAARLAPGRHRILQPFGVTVDPVVPGAFSRLWEIPVAGGYGAIMTTQYASLAKMGTTGGVDRQLLSHSSAAADLLAVKYVLLRRRDLPAAGETTVAGTSWFTDTMDVTVGPPECGQRHTRSAIIALPPDVGVTQVSMFAALRCSEDVLQGTEVATVRMFDERSAYEFPLRAGAEIAEAGLASAELQRRARHTATHGPALTDSDGRSSYLMQFDLPQPLRGARMEVRLYGTGGWMDIRRITVRDASGRDIPVAEMDALLGDRERWRPLPPVFASRASDRLADERVPGEEEILIFENRRARPRAWVAREVVPLNPRDMEIAVHYSQLPDGRRFDPERMGLVEEGAYPALTYESGQPRVVIESLEPGNIRVRVSTAQGGLVVLSESYYPGWQVRLEGGPEGARVVPAARVNLSLQGVQVPPGEHTLTFEFVPRSFRIGGAVSAVTLVVLVAAAAAPRLRRAAHPDAIPRGRRTGAAGAA
jgi:hypothetical protein